MPARAVVACPPSAASDDRIRELLPLLWRVIAACGVPAVDVEDLLQDVLLTYWTKRSEVPRPERWLAAVAGHACRRYWRARRDGAAVAGPPRAPLAGAPRHAGTTPSESAIDCRRALLRLPPRSRSVIELYYWWGCDTAEIARRTGFAAASIETTIRRARARIKRVLEATVR